MGKEEKGRTCHTTSVLRASHAMYDGNEVESQENPKSKAVPLRVSGSIR